MRGSLLCIYEQFGVAVFFPLLICALCVEKGKRKRKPHCINFLFCFLKNFELCVHTTWITGVCRCVLCPYTALGDPEMLCRFLFEWTRHDVVCVVSHWMNCLFIMFVEEHSSCGIHYRFGNRTRSDEISTVCTDWFTAVVIVNMTLFFLYNLYCVNMV